jgi:hypothetical protein
MRGGELRRLGAEELHRAVEVGGVEGGVGEEGGGVVEGGFWEGNSRAARLEGRGRGGGEPGECVKRVGARQESAKSG